MKHLKWEILSKLEVTSTKFKTDDIVKIILKNRGLDTKEKQEEFLNPPHPKDLSLEELGISKKEIKKAIKRLKKAKENKEHVIIYGDYDADGICATAILWECLYNLGFDVLPYIPSRFEEGYGLNTKSVEKLKVQNSKLKLVITVDNGITAFDAVKNINKLGIDVIVTDHHIPERKNPEACAIIQTTKISGSALAWIFAREVRKGLKNQTRRLKIDNGLDLAAIGSVTDQIPLIGPNRSFVKHGIETLRKTKRVGLLSLFEKAQINPQSIGVYAINFLIGPRINALGRLEHGLESLRLLCVKKKENAIPLAILLNNANLERQKVLDKVYLHLKETVTLSESEHVIIAAHESYHEGVIGLAASKLVEEFWRPAIVFSKGKKVSKASARSIPGFNIIEAIRRLDNFLLEGGGHPMAAGFSVKTERLPEFAEKFSQVSKEMLNKDVLVRKLKIDLEISFELITKKLFEKLVKFEPTGIGNPTPIFLTRKVSVKEARVVGKDNSHLKLTLEKNQTYFDAIGFGMGERYSELSTDRPIDIAYSIEQDSWNGSQNLQLRLKDFKIS